MEIVIARRQFIADINGFCKCYKHGYLWKEGAEVKKGRRPKYKIGGACKVCINKSNTWKIPIS